MRAQVLQVVHTCHALAARGHEVTLLANPAKDAEVEAGPLLEAWGLPPISTFHLEIAPTRWSPGAGLWFRWKLGSWCDASPRDSVVYVREAKYLAVVGERPRVVYEAHCLERQRAAEEGEEAGVVEAMERAVLARSAAVVSNSGGTLAALEAAYGPDGGLPAIRRVIHNATRWDRVIDGEPVDPPVIAYTGSARAYKGVAALVEAMAAMPEVTLELIGGVPEGPMPPNVRAVPTVPYSELPARLARCRALVLPLEDNSFGRQFTSPLKLWDYLATGIPIVAADLPTVREIAGELPFYYPPGSASGLRSAVAAALASGPRPRRIRTWDDRALEVEAVLAEVVALPRSAASR
ncbi:hypothetical protein LBMAG42_14480 [Deltaproteobacteria bacterium]|nr:hypothetical protein LBMAG42_14480 [Deltaproteobacteria bacterium]